VDPKEYNACYTESYLGDPKTNPEGYKESNVLTHAHKLKGPVYIAGGSADDNVLCAKHAQRVIDVLQKRGHPLEMTILPGEKHGFSDRNKILFVYKNVVDFFDKHLHPNR
jgi:dipeptidyl-peptidase-4